MIRCLSICFLLIPGLLSPCLGSESDPPSTKNDPAVEARELVGQFMKAMQRRNLDDIMALVDVPWCHDMKTTIYDRKELEVDFSRLLEKHRDRPSIHFEVRPAYPYQDIREKLSETERKDLDKVMRPTDHVVLVYVKNPSPTAKAEQEVVVLFVRHRQGECKIVGLKNRDDR